MKKSELKRKVKGLIKHSLNAKRVERLVDIIVKENHLNLEDFDDDYRLPKQITCVISKQLHQDYTPLNDDKTSKHQIKMWFNMLPFFIGE